MTFDLPDRLASLREAQQGHEAAVAADYIESVCRGLGSLAERSRHRHLAYLLGIAALEAHIVSQRHRVERDKDESVSPKP